MKIFSDEDKVFIQCLRESKKYGAKCLSKMFSGSLWNLSGLQILNRKIDEQAALIGVQAVVDCALPAAA